MPLLQKLKNKSTKLSIGLMSGTSVDGVDAALVKITGSGINTKIDVLHFNIFDYPPGLKEKILNNSQPGHGSIDEICRLNALLGEIFADAALKLIAENKLKPENI